MGLLLATRGPQHGIGTTLILHSMEKKMILIVYSIFSNYANHIFVVEKASVVFITYDDIFVVLGEIYYFNKRWDEIFS